DKGTGLFWSPVPPPGAEGGDPPLPAQVAGDVIRVMWDYGVRIGLWDAEGQLPEDEAWLRDVLGLSTALIADLRRWGAEMDALDVAPERRPDEGYDALNARGRDLAASVQGELGETYRVTFVPW